MSRSTRAAQLTLLTLSSLLLVGGSLGDVYGRRRIFGAGVAGFGGTSLICAVAPNASVLIAALYKEWRVRSSFRARRRSPGDDHLGPTSGATRDQASSVYVRPDGPQLDRLATMFGAGELEIPVGRTFALSDAAAALAAAASGGAGGAVVLRPS
jgi:MFS family permease